MKYTSYIGSLVTLAALVAAGSTATTAASAAETLKVRFAGGSLKVTNSTGKDVELVKDHSLRTSKGYESLSGQVSGKPVTVTVIKSIEADKTGSSTSGVTSKKIKTKHSSRVVDTFTSAHNFKISRSAVDFAIVDFNGSRTMAWPESSKITQVQEPSLSRSNTYDPTKSGSVRMTRSDVQVIQAAGKSNKPAVFNVPADVYSSSGPQRSANPKPSWLSAVYKTFMPQASASINKFEQQGCEIGVGNKKYVSFNGNNRGYQLPKKFVNPLAEESGAFKTGVWAYSPVGAQGAKGSVAVAREVGETVAVREDGKVERRTASADGIKVTNTYVDDGMMLASIDHNVGNPFCNVGSIFYQVSLSAYLNGVVKVQGRYRPVPNHEVYGGGSTAFDPTAINWRWVAKTESEGFNCLVPGVCPVREINQSTEAS